MTDTIIRNVVFNVPTFNVVPGQRAWQGSNCILGNYISQGSSSGTRNIVVLITYILLLAT